MSKHRHHRSYQSRERRDQFAHHPPQAAARISPTLVVGAVAVLLAIVLVYVVMSSSRAGAEAAAEIAGQGSDVSLPVATFADGRARFYRYVTAGGREIRFFVMRSSDGVLRAAFDTCDVCYRARKGYRQSGDMMICNNCGKAFPSRDINVIQGGCNPAPIEREVQDGQIVLRAANLELGGGYF